MGLERPATLPGLTKDNVGNGVSTNVPSDAVAYAVGSKEGGSSLRLLSQFAISKAQVSIAIVIYLNNEMLFLAVATQQFWLGFPSPLGIGRVREVNRFLIIRGNAD